MSSLLDMPIFLCSPHLPLFLKPQRPGGRALPRPVPAVCLLGTGREGPEFSYHFRSISEEGFVSRGTVQEDYVTALSAVPS